MKIFYLIILVFYLSCLFSSTTIAQSTVGIKAGPNLSFIGGNKNTKSIPLLAPMLGVYIDMQASEKFHFQPEIVYSVQGAQFQYNTSPTTSKNPYTTTIVLGYINVPFLAKAYTSEKFYLHFGPQFGLLIGANTIYEYSTTKTKSSILKPYNREEIALAFGFGFDLSKNLNLGTRLNYGITNMYGKSIYSSQLPQLYNRVLQINLGYALK